MTIHIGAAKEDIAETVLLPAILIVPNGQRKHFFRTCAW